MNVRRWFSRYEPFHATFWDLHPRGVKVEWDWRRGVKMFMWEWQSPEWGIMRQRVIKAGPLVIIFEIEFY